MSPLWHLLFWVALPAVLYIAVRSYDDMRHGR